MNYSQHNEQEIILRFFGNHNGRCLDIGAHDGESLSNTRALIVSGWSGVMVEPHPIHFMKLWELYGGNSNITLVNAAIGADSTFAKLFFNYEWPAYSSTLSKEKAEEFKENDYSKSFYVPVLGVRTLEQFGPFDFVSIDAEGVEPEIMVQSDGILFGTKLICIEKSPASETTLRTQLLGRHGFSIIAETPENIIASR